VIDDVGSGCLYNLAPHGLRDEPIVSESVRAGADLVLFSGDKLLGGPQCGIIVGKRAHLNKLRTNPLARALRVDKLTLAALQGTLEIHRAGRAFTEIPVLRQLTLAADEIHPRAEKLLEELRAQSQSSGAFMLVAVESASGGGALPDLTVPSWAIAISSNDADRVAQQLRLGEPAVFGRVQGGKTLIDLRTVQPQDEQALLHCLLACKI
jgi:L-seryl-tRNA(Ser) seleniumtransferase